MQGHNRGLMGVYKILHDWNDMTATWETWDTGKPWARNGCEFGPRLVTADLPAEANLWKTYNVLPVIRELVKSPATNHGMLTKQEGGDAEDYNTSESPDVSKRPKLTVMYTGGTVDIRHQQKSAALMSVSAGFTVSNRALLMSAGGSGTRLVTITTTDGRTVLSRVVDKSCVVDLRDLGKGTYLVMARSVGESMNARTRTCRMTVAE